MPASPNASETSQAHDLARAWAIEWCQRWFLDADGTDRFRLGGVDAGWATHVEAYYVLLAFASTQLGAESTPASLLARLKAAGLDRLIRSAGLLAIGSGRGDVGSADAGSEETRGHDAVACLLEIPTPSMADGVLAVARALPGGGRVVAADPRALRRARRSGVAARPLSVSVKTQLRLLLRGRHEARDAFDAIRRRPPRMVLDGSDVSTAALDALRPLASRSAPWLLPEKAALAAALDPERTKSVVMASDQHRIGRLATSLARDRGIRSIVVQHGLPQIPIGMLPVVAGRVAVWSESARDWFMEHGTPEERLVIAGNPRWQSRSRPTRSARPLIVVALSPTSIAANRNVIRLVLGAAQHVAPEPMIVIKLHPGHRDWGWVDDVIRGRPTVRVALAEPIEPLLARADATVVLRSTVAIDALAAGSPVVLVRVPDGLSGADAELRGSGLPVAASEGELGKALRRVAGQDGRARYFAERHADVDRLIGPLDGAHTVAALASGEPT